MAPPGEASPLMELRIIDLEDDVDVTGKKWSRLLLLTSTGTREKVIPREEADAFWVSVSAQFDQATGQEFDPNAPVEND